MIEEESRLESAYEREGLSTCGLAIREYDGIVAFHCGTHVAFRNSVVHWLVFRPRKDLIKVEFRGWVKCRLGVLRQKLDGIGDGYIPGAWYGRWANAARKLPLSTHISPRIHTHIKRKKGSPNRNEDLIFLSVVRNGQLAFIDVRRDISRLDRLKIDKCFFGVDPAHVHGHVSSIHEQRRRGARAPWGRRCFGPGPVALLCRRPWNGCKGCMGSRLDVSDPSFGREGSLVFFGGVAEDGRSGQVATRDDRERPLGREYGAS